MRRQLGWALALALFAAGTMTWNAAAQAAPQFATVTAYEAVLRNGFSIRHDHREVIQDVTRLYVSASPDSGYVDVPTAEIVSVEKEEIPVPRTADPAKPADVSRLVTTASDQHQIDADLIHSVIGAESGYNPRAVSPKGAQGLMQLMPGTASHLRVKNAFEPAENVDGGTRYLRELLLRYNNDLAKALAAYNAGPERVTQYGGVPPYYETRAYVGRVIRDFNRKKLAQKRSCPLPTAGSQPAVAAKTARACSQSNTKDERSKPAAIHKPAGS